VVVHAFAGVLIADGDVEFGRSQTGEGEQAERREDRLERRQRYEVVQPPVGRGELRLNEANAAVAGGWNWHRSLNGSSVNALPIGQCPGRSADADIRGQGRRWTADKAVSARYPESKIGQIEKHEEC